MMVRRYFVSGKVQGVGFRAFVWREARGLELAGWVRNLRDGRVEALVAADAESHALLRSRLEDGPGFSRVDSVEVVHESADASLFEGFEIARDG